MKKVKKLLCVLLAVWMACSCLAFVSSAEGETAPGEEIVAQMSVCCRVVFFGHVWLYFKNQTDHELKVGAYTVPAGEGVSVGTMCFTRMDGAGIYYNVEAYCGNKLGMSGAVSRTMELTASQLETVSQEIVSRNSWTLAKNCGYFASEVWNSVAADKISYKFLPIAMKGQLKDGKPSMFVPLKSQVFKQQGSGSGATLKQCSAGSLIMFVG